MIILRGSTIHHGRLEDIGGTAPLRIRFNTAAGPLEFGSDRIGRIYLGNPGGGVPTAAAPPTPTPTLTPAAPPAAPAGSINVPGNVAWTPTNIVVRRGEVLTFQSGGEVQASADPADVASVAGTRTQRYAIGGPIPNSLAGALVGRIGSGQPFGIGDQTRLTMPSAGPLFLGINDDNVSDNTGNFWVLINRAQ
jgi:hypothetical protein